MLPVTVIRRRCWRPNAPVGRCSVCRRSGRWPSCPGPAPPTWSAQLRAPLEVGGDGTDRFVVRAPDWTTLGLALNSTERPSGSRVRIEVDPARL